MLTLELLKALLSPEGQHALQRAASFDLRPEQRLRTIDRLRTEFAPDLATAALEMAVLRQRATAKWSRGAELYWTREALEQASGELVAQHRVARYQPWTAVTDLCCGVGGDLLAFAQAGLHAIGIDHDPLRLALAAANAAVLGLPNITLKQGDVSAFQPAAGSVLFFDPARRSGERRVFNPADYSPPLHTLTAWLSDAAGLGVKVAPGIDYSDLPWPAEVEIVSVGGEVKEAALWFGALRQVERRATLLPAGISLDWTAVPTIAVTPPARYLYEPDGAVIRAHLVEQLAHLIGATKIDPEIAFLTSPHYSATPFARAFEISETLPFNLKQLRSRLRTLGIGHVVVKKRGSPLDPQVLEKQLRLTGERTMTIILTQLNGKPSVLLGQPVA